MEGTGISYGEEGQERNQRCEKCRQRQLLESEWHLGLRRGHAPYSVARISSENIGFWNKNNKSRPTWSSKASWERVFTYHKWQQYFHYRVRAIVPLNTSCFELTSYAVTVSKRLKWTFLSLLYENKSEQAQLSLQSIDHQLSECLPLAGHL